MVSACPDVDSAVGETLVMRGGSYENPPSSVPVRFSVLVMEMDRAAPTPASTVQISSMSVRLMGAHTLPLATTRPEVPNREPRTVSGTPPSAGTTEGVTAAIFGVKHCANALEQQSMYVRHASSHQHPWLDRPPQYPSHP